MSDILVETDGETLHFTTSFEMPAKECITVLRGESSLIKVLYVEVQANDYKLWWETFEVLEATTVVLNLRPRSFIGICYTFKNDINYVIHGLPKGVSRKDSYNIMFLPSIEARCSFKKGTTNSFGIEFTKSYFDKQPSKRTVKIRKQIFLKRAKIFYEHFLPITGFIRDIIFDLKKYIWRATSIDWIHLNAKVAVLIDVSIPSEDENIIPNIFVHSDRLRAKKIIQIIEYIFNNPGNDLSMEAIALEFGISTVSLRRGIKYLYGTLPSKIILEARLQAGRKLLLNSDLPLKVLVQQIGVADVSHFSKAFRKRFGKWPSEFRKYNGDI